MDTEPNYDLFISYTEADQDWVEDILLPGLSLPKERVITQNPKRRDISEGFRHGVRILDEFERAIITSRYTVVVLSPAFFADQWATFGGGLASFTAVEEQSERLIPLLLESCSLPGFFKSLVKLDCTNKEDWKEKITQLREKLNQPEPAEEGSILCPYPGMVPFSEKEAAHFFGRDDDIDRIRMRLNQQNCLFVTGRSGFGKSSLIAAGLIPQLHKREPGQWLVKSLLRPGINPMLALTNILGIAQTGEPLSVEVCTQCVEALLASEPTAQRFLLFIDQLEEVFTQTPQQDQLAFIASLRSLQQVPKCVLLFTMRADFFPNLRNTDLWHLASNGRLEIDFLRGDNLRKAIEEPAKAARVYLEKALVERLLADAADEPGVLPLLQATMEVLWWKMEHRSLTLRNYVEIDQNNPNALVAALANKAETALAPLTEDQPDIARRIFLRLVQFGEGRGDTRRQQSVAALYSAGDDANQFDQTLKHLINHRLLIPTGMEEKHTDQKVDLAHDALITGWHTLQTWLTEFRSSEQTRRRLEAKADEWLRLGQGEGGLLDEIQLGEVEKWLVSIEAGLLGYSTRLQGLAEVSRRQLTQKNQEAERLRRESERNREIALARLLAAQSELMQEQQPELLERSVLLAIEAMQLYHCLETDQALRHSLSQFGHLIFLLEERDDGGKHPLCDVVFSKDGRYVITSCEGGTAKIWDRKSGQRLACLSHGKRRVNAVACSSDSRYVGTACDDGKARIWEWQIADDEPVLYLEHDGSVNAIVFSPDDQYVATASNDGTAQVSRITSNEHIIHLRHKDNRRVNAVTLSPDSQYVATASSDKTAKVWRRDSEVEEFTLPHTGIVKAAVFSPNGRYIATASWDHSARVWNATTGDQVACLIHRERINAVAFSPDGRYVATASDDNTAGVWETTNSGYLLIRPVHQGHVKAVAFSPNSSLLLTASDDAKIWEAESGRQIARLSDGGSVNKVAFSTDGNSLATAGDDGAARIWKTTGGDQHLSFYHKSRVNALAFSKDSRYIATACEDGFARIWDTSDGFEQQSLEHKKPVNAITFSPDNRYVATASADSYARLWAWDREARESGLLKEIAHRGNVKAVIFSADGSYLATASNEDTALLWRVRSARGPICLRSGDVNAVVFSRNGTFVATASGDGRVQVWKTVQVWETANNTPIFEREHPNGSVVDVIFSPDERTLISTDGAGMTYVWDVENCERLHEFNPQGIVNAITLNSDGRYLAMAIVGQGSKGGVWEMGDYQQLFPLIHEDPVRAVAFSPCSEYLVTVCKDSATIWSREDGRQVACLRHRESVNAVTFSPDGRYIATASADGAVIVWLWRPEDLIAAARSRVKRNLTEEERRQYMGSEAEGEEPSRVLGVAAYVDDPV